MAWIILRGLAVLVVLGVLMLAGPAQASIIPVTLQFDNPSWSGTVSFDDTTGEPWLLFPLLTVYEIAGMTISDGVRTWTEDELVAPDSFPDEGGVIVDTNGRPALEIIAADTFTGVTLRATFGGSSGVIGSSAVRSFIPGGDTLSDSSYIGSVSAVSVPSTLVLVASGLMGLGSVAWRRRR